MVEQSPLTLDQRKQLQLAKFSFWDESEHTLWIDCRKIFPALGVVSVPSWDAMMMSAAKVDAYPSNLQVLAWANTAHINAWRKPIPKWVQESCALFPTHQLSLLHYAGKYPQMLELLDNSPMLAWRLVSAGLSEPEVVGLLGGKRQLMAKQMGWPGKDETIRFLRNLRLRIVNDDIAQQVEVCLMDEQRLNALQTLPRINSMALSLAARFPELIGCRLHMALAQLPCRPMQCKSMVELLEDAYALADYLGLSPAELKNIGECRYLIEVSQLYQGWLTQALQGLEVKALNPQRLSAQPTVLHRNDWHALSVLQQHAWWVNVDGEPVEGESTANTQPCHLLAWQDEEGVWAALIDATNKVLKVRGLDNVLAGSKQLTQVHLWQAGQL
ncbi:hypothetical protein [Thiomicrorhabdus aquaedulcis]|uniref:hypothetical protein n=1 Tax=Thiomicrorhabdus aquaedulcis TaxID=2211106 RepID=UPI000FD6CA30|nr:hypothetical protein [Thiomicrorhabdus aquaedulcis]